MDKKEIVCFVLMAFGILIMIIVYNDVTSIISSILNKVFNLNLPDVLFNSFIFRAIVISIGGAFLLLSGLLYKKHE